jgi:hypothetical protein
MGRTYIKFTASGKGLPAWTGWIPLAFGLMFLLSGLYYEFRFVFLGQDTTGEIVRFEGLGRSTRVYLNYQTANGQPAQCRQTLLMREKFALRQRVPLRYLPDNPSLGRIKTFYQLWLPFTVKLTLGLGLTALAIALFQRKLFGLSEQKPPASI